MACSPAAAAPAPTEDPRVSLLSAQVADLTQQVQTLTAQRDVALANQLGAAIEAGKNQPIVTWNTPVTIPAGGTILMGLQDNFTVHVQFTASTPVRSRVVSFDQYVALATTGAGVATRTYPATTSLDVVIHDSEECGAYLLVMDAAREAIVVPNFVITQRQQTGAGIGGACNP